MARVNKTSVLGFGCSLFKDCSKNMKSSSGINRVYESIYGRLVDKLFYAPDYGIQLAKRLRTTSPLTWATLAEETETELLKDDRLVQVEVDIEYDETTKIVNVYINGTVSTGETFNLIGDVNLLTTEQIRFNI